MGTGWLINYLTNRTQRTELQKELRQKRIALEKIRKICVDEIEKILKSRNNRAITVASRQFLTAAEADVKETLTTAEEEDDDDDEEEGGQVSTGEEEEDQGKSEATLLIFLVAILCYASYTGKISNEDISSSIDICTGIRSSCLQELQNAPWADNDLGSQLLACISSPITYEAEVEAGDTLTRSMKNRKRQPISSLKKQLKLATYNLENIRNYCKKILIESVSKERNSRAAIGVGVLAVAYVGPLAAIACTYANPTASNSEIQSCAEDLINCLLNSTSTTAQEACFSDLT